MSGLWGLVLSVIAPATVLEIGPMVFYFSAFAQLAAAQTSALLT